MKSLNIPSSCKVVVIGGGVIGCSVAYHLTKFGWSDVVLHCNAKENEMEIVAENSPFISKFVIKKTSQFYKIIS